MNIGASRPILQNAKDLVTGVPNCMCPLEDQIRDLRDALQAVIEHLQQKDEIYSDVVAKIEEQIGEEEQETTKDAVVVRSADYAALHDFLSAALMLTNTVTHPDDCSMTWKEEQIAAAGRLLVQIDKEYAR